MNDHSVPVLFFYYLQNSAEELISFATIPNPFTTKLIAEVTAQEAQIIHLQLIDNYGKVIHRK